MRPNINLSSLTARVRKAYFLIGLLTYSIETNHFFKKGMGSLKPQLLIVMKDKRLR